MTASNLHAEIKKAQGGVEPSVLHLLEQFQPLLRKYGLLLHYEDAYWDLRLAFLELIQTFPTSGRPMEDKTILAYLSKSVYHAYIALSKAQRKYQCVFPFSSILDGERSREKLLETLTPVYDEYPVEVLDLLSSVLTERETQVIVCLYLWDYSNKMASERLHITPGAVTKARKRALRKLREQLRREGR